MTKEKFKKYNKENTFCDSCKRLLSTKYFSYKILEMIVQLIDVNFVTG